MERARKSVVRIVRDLNRLFLRLEGDDAKHRPEDLLARNARGVGDVVKDGGLDVVALGADALAAREDSPLLLPDADVLHHAVELHLGDGGALPRLVLKGISHLRRISVVSPLG